MTDEDITLNGRGTWTAGLEHALETRARPAIQARVDRDNRLGSTDYYKALERAHLDVLRAAVESTDPAGVRPKERFWKTSGAYIGTFVDAILKEPSLTFPTAIRLLVALREDTWGTRLHDAMIRVLVVFHERTGHPTLLEAGRLLEIFGIEPARLLNSWGAPGSPLADWPDADVWPFFERHLELLLGNLLAPQSWFPRDKAFLALATFPEPPAAAMPQLMQVALGASRVDRFGAQSALARLPGKEALIIEALADGKAEVRAAAARWLGDLHHLPAIEVLDRACRKEKGEAAKGAMLDALERLGQPLTKYLDRSVLLAEAAKLLSKGIPRELAWLRFDELPPLRWVDDQQAVHPDIRRWFVVQAHKLKSPAPNPLLRKYCQLLDATGREAFGQALLEAWIEEDVRPMTPAEKRELALDYLRRSGRYSNLAEEDAIAAAMEHLHHIGRSAIDSKGVLAVAAACGSLRAVEIAGAYLVKYYGWRPGQGRALIQMLAWIEHPSATQMVLSIGNRFRTKGLQEEAAEQAAALAERRGWTLAELADRTIPTAGFGDDGILELSYGARTFTARLGSDLSIQLEGSDGKAIASLPEARRDDDEAAAARARKALGAAKKELKRIVDAQRMNLYDAMCARRGWPFDDWQRYLQGHPVARHLIQRLVWQVEDTLVTFRPLDDGTLTDVADEPLEIAPASRIVLAHASTVTQPEAAAWPQSLVDYAVAPLFPQFGRARLATDAALLASTRLGRFEGHAIESFTLRNRATKLGWLRGATGDGGWFNQWEKRFPSSQLVAAIRFSGSPLPETNNKVWLIALVFRPLDEGADVRLGKVPPVLLEECWNDLGDLAAAGSGYDPEWTPE